MATILNDKELKKLIGAVIVGGDEKNIRPNSYVLRLGEDGEFIGSEKTFKLSDKKKGICISPGHSVALTSFETLNFSREAVHSIFPGHALHAIISPTTDLSREGIVAPTTQVDAGFCGTLNWTINNTSGKERYYRLKEQIFRMLIFKLDEDEIPEELYNGSYQNKTGYVPSERPGPPVGIKSIEWEDSILKDGPEKALENLMKSGYPYNILGERLKIIDNQFATVTSEYDKIKTSIDSLSNNIRDISQSNITLIKDTFKEQASLLQNTWLLKLISTLIVLSGFAISISTSDKASLFLKQNGSIIGCLMIFIGFLILITSYFKKK